MTNYLEYNCSAQTSVYIASTMALRRLLVNVSNVKTRLPVLQTSTRAMGGGAAPTPAPFARMAKPTRPLTEEHELIWDDGVAPETCIDFDVPNYTRNEGRDWFLSGLGFFAVLYGVIYFWDAPGRKRTVTRTMPFNGLEQELGGYKNP